MKLPDGILCRIMVLSLFTTITYGCAEAPSREITIQLPIKSVVGYNYSGADEIAAQIEKSKDTIGPILISSLSNVNILESSSTFGRISADEIGSRLSQHGIKVLEARIRDEYIIRKEGEFMLSDELRAVAKEQRASSVLVGTYADSGAGVLVSLKLVSLFDSTIIGSSDYTVPMNAAMREAMFGKIGDEGGSATVSKITVY